MSAEISNRTDAEQKSLTLFLATMFIIVQFVVIIVLVMQINNQDKNETHIRKDYVNKNLITFEMLPQEVKNLYMLRKSTGILNKSISQDSSYNNLSNQNEYTQYIDQDKIVFLSQTTCQDMFFGSHKTTQPCLNTIEEFFKNKNKNMIFEVIPLVQSNDLIDLGRVVDMLTQSKYKKYYLNKDIINNFIQYTKDGLAHNRLQQGIIQIRKYIGKKAKIRFNQDYKFSNNQSGFIIKAYNVL